MAAAPVFFEHPASLEHDTGGHPENSRRIVGLIDELERRSWLGFERVQSPRVEREVLELVHPRAYVDALERAAAAGGGSLDADTLISSGSFEAALRSSGGADAMVERLVAGGAGSVGFSAHRPPGHHALPARAMGFCLFNNIAVAARFALDRLGLERVLILDWDVHHGNGTNDIFRAESGVLFISIHESPLYPGTGGVGDVGLGDARGCTVNLPVPPGTGDDVYLGLVEWVVAPLARLYEPQLVLVSAGYDAHRDDPLADCEVTEAGFAAMTRVVRELGRELAVPVGCVLEGGYNVGALARSVAATMEMLAAPVEDGVRVGSEPVALAVEARERLSEFWPGLG